MPLYLLKSLCQHLTLAMASAWCVLTEAWTLSRWASGLGLWIPAIRSAFWTVFEPLVGALMYMFRYKKPVVDDLVVNMVDVGEESGELDTMLYKVADTYDEEVAVLTETLTSLMEPLLIVFLGGAVGFIVIALFLPLIKLIQDLS